MNIAFGFSLIGYEVHIINNWNLSEPKKIWDNVYISNQPNQNEIYDIAFTYDNISILNSNNYIHKILMTYQSSSIRNALKYMKENNIEVILVSTHESVKNANEFNLKYFPALFPIPSINIGFIPYKFEPKNSELKVYVYHSSWTGSAYSSLRCCKGKQSLILNFLKTKGYNLNIFIHVENEIISNQCLSEFTLSNSKINYICNDKVHYDDIIKIFKEVDLCIPIGGLDYPGSGVMDMLSLGKPIISVVDGVNKDKDGNIFQPFNTLYKCSDNLIMVQESNDLSFKKLERIFSTPSTLEESYNCYKNSIKDYDFNNWKSYVEKFLKTYYN